MSGRIRKRSMHLSEVLIYTGPGMQKNRPHRRQIRMLK
jgi:hypothetical protein